MHALDGASHDLVYVTTKRAAKSAFDARSGQQVWKASLDTGQQRRCQITTSTPLEADEKTQWPRLLKQTMRRLAEGMSSQHLRDDLLPRLERLSALNVPESVKSCIALCAVEIGKKLPAEAMKLLQTLQHASIAENTPPVKLKLLRMLQHDSTSQVDRDVKTAKLELLHYHGDAMVSDPDIDHFRRMERAGKEVYFGGPLSSRLDISL